MTTASHPSRVFSFLALALILPAFAAPLRAGAPVEFVPGGRYFDVLMGEVAKASSSVTCYMYVYSLHPGDGPKRTVRLAEALSAAARRGLRVEVVLNRRAAPGGEGEGGEMNRRAAAYLDKAGVRVFFEDSPSLLHAKAVVIDGAAALTGSSNWSEASFTRNWEMNVLVRDPALVRPMAAALAKIPRTRFVPEDAGAVRVPAAFLTDPGGLRRICRGKNMGAFDLYLWLLRETQRQGRATVRLSYRELAPALGMRDRPPEAYQQTLRKNLRRLERRYKLISVAPGEGAVKEISLAPLAGETIAIPQAYWDFGWDRRLSFPAKIMLLLSQYHSARSPSPPRWSRSKTALAREYGISDVTLDKGTVELQRADLLEVENHPLGADWDAPRESNDYTPNPFYDPRERERELARLRESRGLEKVERARRIAAVLYEDSDLGAVDDLVGLEEFGRERVERVLRQVARKHPANPKRSVAYLIAAVRNTAGDRNPE